MAGLEGRGLTRRTGRRLGVVMAVTAGLITVACSSVGPGHAAQAPAVAASPSAAGQAIEGSADPARSNSASSGTSVGVLAGMVVGIDPGHNGLNGADPSYINQLIWNGREQETCDTTGTQTDGGYTEALFNFRVAMFLRADLLGDRAQVVMTRASNHGVGPCVNRRARILNASHAHVAIDIHADGGPPSGRGFTVLEPVADGTNDQVIAASDRFGSDVRWAFLHYTSMPVSTYDGVDGIIQRNDLAGLNLTRVPKVLVECGNMRNATDAALLVSPAFQRRIAHALEAAIIRFLGKGY
jgi:N-acetylmuramoyl-L-alanine amidase